MSIALFLIAPCNPLLLPSFEHFSHATLALNRVKILDEADADVVLGSEFGPQKFNALTEQPEEKKYACSPVICSKNAIEASKRKKYEASVYWRRRTFSDGKLLTQLDVEGFVERSLTWPAIERHIQDCFANTDAEDIVGHKRYKDLFPRLSMHTLMLKGRAILFAAYHGFGTHTFTETAVEAVLCMFLVHCVSSNYGNCPTILGGDFNVSLPDAWHTCERAPPDSMPASIEEIMRRFTIIKRANAFPRGAPIDFVVTINAGGIEGGKAKVMEGSAASKDVVRTFDHPLLLTTFSDSRREPSA